MHNNLGPKSLFSERHQQRDFLKEGNDFNGSYYYSLFHSGAKCRVAPPPPPVYDSPLILNGHASHISHNLQDFYLNPVNYENFTGNLWDVCPYKVRG